MAVIVQKYGGSSVADIDKLRRVADKVVAARRAGNDVVVTVSAMGKTTDNLIGLAREAASVNNAPGEPQRRELDMLVSTGERVSMALLAIAIEARGERAISFTGSQSGIITNDRHFDARIIEVRPHRIEDELARGRVVIVAGYQGMSYKREITTLGRGGSDTTAVALAAALSAERCEIYSDVDGVYSADPRAVPDARHLPELDPEVLQEMAEAGAKVLNAQAVEWARKAKIAIYARSTADSWDRSSDHRQTVVRELAAPGHRARAVVAENNLVLGRLDRGGLEALDRLAAWSVEREVPLKDLSLTAEGGTFAIPLLNVPDWARARPSLVEAAGPALSLREGLSAVSVVGDGLSTTGKPLADFLGALRAAEIRPVAVHGSALRLSALIEPASSARAQQALHARFCLALGLFCASMAHPLPPASLARRAAPALVALAVLAAPLLSAAEDPPDSPPPAGSASPPDSAPTAPPPATSSAPPPATSAPPPATSSAPPPPTSAPPVVVPPPTTSAPLRTPPPRTAPTATTPPPPPPQTSPPPPPPPPKKRDAGDDDKKDDKKDGERGNEWLWLSGEGGLQYLSLTTLSSEGKLVPGIEKTSATGPFAGVSAGIRLFFLTVGLRARAAQFSQFMYWTLDPEIAFRFSGQGIQPYLLFGGGYSALGSLDEKSLSNQSGAKVRGFNIRAGFGLDFYLNNYISLGVLGTGEVTAMTRPGVSASDLNVKNQVPAQGTIDTSDPAKAQAQIEAAKAEADAKAAKVDGSGVGLAASLSAVLGFHF